MRRPFCALLLVALLATAASAQYRAPSSQRLEGALALPPRPAPRVAALMLEHATAPALADGQPFTVLSPAQQQQRAAELENDARKQMDEERGRRGGDAGDGERRRDGVDRPPEG